MRRFPLAVLALLAVPLAASAAPTTLSQSGRLLDAAGDALNQTSAVTFTLYDASSATLWSESQQVTFSDGYYAVVLGNASPLPAAAFLNDTSLEVAIGGVVLGRQPVTSTPSALSVRGAVRLTDAPATCNPSAQGTLRMNGVDLQFCDGTSWRRIAAEPASGITSGQVGQWDQAYAWGDHSAAGYVTTDTLASLTCAANEQPMRAPGGATWVCGPPTPGSNLIDLQSGGWSSSPTLATVALPSGQSGVVHHATGDGNPARCYQWGVSPRVPADRTKTYAYSVWIKSSDLDMNNYLGFYAYDNAGAQILGTWQNPYFKVSKGDPNTWVRHTGYLLPSATPDANSDGHPDSDLLGSTGLDWIMPTNIEQTLLRFGSCYSATPGGESWFAHPTLREVDNDIPEVSHLRVYRSSTMATMTATGASVVIPGVSNTFYAKAGTPVTVQLYAHQRCNGSYFYTEARLDDVIVAVSGESASTSWRTNSNILWNGTVSTTGTHTVTAAWQGGTTCTSNAAEMGAGGANVSLTSWVGQ